MEIADYVNLENPQQNGACMDGRFYTVKYFIEKQWFDQEYSCAPNSRGRE